MSFQQLFRFCAYNAADMAGRPSTKEAPSFGKRLAAIRKQQGLSQAQLAERLGSTRSNIDYYERRATNPTLDFIQRCAEVLGVKVPELVGEDAMPKRKRGPSSRLEQVAERISKLPRTKQNMILDMVEGAIDKAS